MPVSFHALPSFRPNHKYGSRTTAAALRPGCLARSLQQLARRPVSSELRTSGLSSRPVRPSHPRRHLCEVGWRRERMQCGLTNSINELGRPPTASHSTVPSARELHLTRQLNLGVSGLHPNLKKFRMQSGVDVAARPSLADGDPHQAAAATQLCWPGDPNLQEAKQISSAFGLLDAALSLESEERERRAATRVAAFSSARPRMRQPRGGFADVRCHACSSLHGGRTAELQQSLSPRCPHPPSPRN